MAADDLLRDVYWDKTMVKWQVVHPEQGHLKSWLRKLSAGFLPFLFDEAKNAHGTSTHAYSKVR
jgi:hypothetical protein